MNDVFYRFNVSYYVVNQGSQRDMLASQFSTVKVIALINSDLSGVYRVPREERESSSQLPDSSCSATR